MVQNGSVILDEGVQWEGRDVAPNGCRPVILRPSMPCYNATSESWTDGARCKPPRGPANYEFGDE